jgi:hypothetical protein
MRKYIIVGALAFLLVPGQARADWLFTPFVGGTFGPGVGAGERSRRPATEPPASRIPGTARRRRMVAAYQVQRDVVFEIIIVNLT